MTKSNIDYMVGADKPVLFSKNKNWVWGKSFGLWHYHCNLQRWTGDVAIPPATKGQRCSRCRNRIPQAFKMMIMLAESKL